MPEPSEQDPLQAELQHLIRNAVSDLVDQFVVELRDRGIDVANVRIVESPPVSVRASIIALVQKHDYLTSTQIANQLQDEITTKSDDPRRVIVSTVSALVREHILVRNALSHLSVTRKEEALTR